jgi:hypothetical protein
MAVIPSSPAAPAANPLARIRDAQELLKASAFAAAGAIGPQTSLLAAH